MANFDCVTAKGQFRAWHPLCEPITTYPPYSLDTTVKNILCVPSGLIVVLSQVLMFYQHLTAVTGIFYNVVSCLVVLSEVVLTTTLS